MAKLEVVLKQNTPIIHFQYDQAGATIRGSELKPRLDEFLRKHAFDKQEDYTRFTVGYEENNTGDVKCKALDYRVKIETEGRIITETVPNGTPYFYMQIDKHRAVRVEQVVNVVFLSKYNELLKKIEGSIVDFFLVNNFGFRKGKGFGSFSVTKINDQIVRDFSYEKEIKKIVCNDKDKYEQQLYELSYKGNGNWLSVEREIKKAYSIMKSGINFHGYTRSILMKKYAYMKGYSNEKRKMKETIKSIRTVYYDNERGERVNARTNKYKGNKYHYVRAMLGLADHFEFGGKERTVQVKHLPKEKEEGIMRFDSPLLFKPIKTGNGWKIYIILKKIPKRMFNQEFLFENEGDKFTITTPSEKEFNLVEFMDVVVNHNIGICKVN